MSWSKRPVTWRDPVTHRKCISVVFTWHLPRARQEILDGDLECDLPPIVGGPAVRLMPDYLADVAEVGWDSPGALQRHNSDATRTTTGCPGGCIYCGVRRIEPEHRELESWPIAPIVCDNNITAASRPHFERVIESVRGLRGVDFQGVEARMLKPWHAEAFASLKPKPVLHLAWDSKADEQPVLRAIDMLLRHGIPAANIRVYVLFGYRDTPEYALYRFNKLKALGVMPDPMRYQPLDALKVDEYVAPGWTDKLLRDMRRFWYRAALWRKRSFEDYQGGVNVSEPRDVYVYPHRLGDATRHL